MTAPALTPPQQAYLAAVRSDPMVFLQQAFQTIYPGERLMPNWHIDAIVHCLEQARAGLMPRLTISLPPRHLKSFITSIAWPAFLLGHDPSAKLICVSYSDELARALSRDFRRILESVWYRQIFPNVVLTKVTENELVTNQGGFRYATSVGGTLTGRGADFILVDDPIKPDDAASEKGRKAVNDWYSSTLLTRLDDKQRSVLVVIMQRLHVNDLIGFVEAGGGFKKLSFPAIARKDERIALRNGLWHERREGEALHPERESLEVLLAMRQQMGEFTFAAQYQQSPQTPDGSLFKRKWFRFIDQPPRGRRDGKLILSIDTATSTAETADYTAFTLVYLEQGSEGGVFTVLRSERGRWPYEALKDRVLRYRKAYGEELMFVIESTGVGLALIRFLKDAQIPCLHYVPRLDKVARAAWVLPVIAAGRVQVLNKAGENDWVEDWLNEFVNFPFGKFDDQVDSLVQLIDCERRLFACGGRVEVIY